jgi:hypothetical protein
MKTMHVNHDSQALIMQALCAGENLDIENGEILFEPLGIAVIFEDEDEAA